GENILVLGTGEFVWEPFLLAERLEAAGAQVVFSSTTRSPISTGYAIQSAIAFSDNYGLGIPNYVYNVAHQQFDRILICCETPASSVDPRLLEALSAVAPTVEVITYE
ncbi:TRSP domain-containing protein, partial [Klebsiella pneumoniae]